MRKNLKLNKLHLSWYGMLYDVRNSEHSRVVRNKQL